MLNLIGEAQSLKRLQLRYALLYLGLLVFSGAMGIAGLHLWSEASGERDRLAFMSGEVQEMRGSLYRQIKEVFDHAFLADREAANEFADYARDIDRHFTNVYERAGDADEHAAVDLLHQAYRGVRSYGETFLRAPADEAMAQGRRLDTQLERGAFHDFEQRLSEFERLLVRRRNEVDHELGTLRLAVPALLVLPLLLATVIFIVFRRYLRLAVANPLASIMEATRNISCGRLDHRVPETGAAELVELARAINAMASDLASSREALLIAEKQATLSALVPVVAHNIRNPLASIRAIAQVMDDPSLPADVREGLADIIGVTDRLDKWTYALLSYLHPLRPQRTPVAVAALFDTVADVAGDRLEARGIRLQRLGWGDDCVIALDLHLMEQALAGLLDNAIEASAPGGTITLRYVCTGGSIALSIRDYGSGMASSPAPRGLAPLATTKLQGSGLGIPFAAKVCDVHGGRLEFILHDPGAEAIVILPLEDAHADQRPG